MICIRCRESFSRWHSFVLGTYLYIASYRPTPHIMMLMMLMYHQTLIAPTVQLFVSPHFIEIHLLQSNFSFRPSMPFIQWPIEWQYINAVEKLSFHSQSAKYGAYTPSKHGASGKEKLVHLRLLWSCYTQLNFSTSSHTAYTICGMTFAERSHHLRSDMKLWQSIVN